MGWLGDFVKSLKGSDAVDLMFVDGLQVPGGVSGPAAVRDQCYVMLYLESLRLERARRFSSKFHGVVYTFARLARRGEGTAELAAVSKPNKIAELDENSLGKVITVSKQMMGAVPWRGGDLQLEIGLFSVKSGDVLSPVINLVTKISDTAGISFVGAVKPFVPLITEGMAMLAGQTKDVALEVGTDTSLTLTGPTTCAIIAARKGTLDPSQLSIDPADRKLLYQGQPLQKGYCVFTVRTTDRKPDYGEIPDLKAKFEAFLEQVNKGLQNEAKEALNAFRRAAVTSPDLISADARQLVMEAEQTMQDAFPGGPISAEPRRLPRSLADLPLYAEAG